MNDLEKYRAELLALIPENFTVTEDLQLPMVSSHKVKYSMEILQDIKHLLGDEYVLPYICRMLATDFHDIEIHGYGPTKLMVCEEIFTPWMEQEIYFDGHYKWLS